METLSSAQDSKLKEEESIIFGLFNEHPSVDLHRHPSATSRRAYYLD